MPTLLDFHPDDEGVLMCGNLEWVDWPYLLSKGLVAVLLLFGIGMVTSFGKRMRLPEQSWGK